MHKGTQLLCDTNLAAKSQLQIKGCGLKGLPEVEMQLSIYPMGFNMALAEDKVTLHHKRKLDFNVIEMTFIIHVFALNLNYRISRVNFHVCANIYTKECNIIIACMHAAKGCYSAKIQSAKTFNRLFAKVYTRKIYLLYNISYSQRRSV